MKSVVAAGLERDLGSRKRKPDPARASGRAGIRLAVLSDARLIVPRSRHRLGHRSRAPRKIRQ